MRNTVCITVAMLLLVASGSFANIMVDNFDVYQYNTAYVTPCLVDTVIKVEGIGSFGGTTNMGAGYNQIQPYDSVGFHVDAPGADYFSFWVYFDDVSSLTGSGTGQWFTIFSGSVREDGGGGWSGDNRYYRFDNPAVGWNHYVMSFDSNFYSEGTFDKSDINWFYLSCHGSGTTPFEVRLDAFEVIPEPSSLAALGTCLIGMFGFALRRRR